MKLTIDDVDLSQKRVLIRVDFNVPIENGQITDDLRIVESVPTIKKVIESNAKAILISHLGRPDGKIVEELRMDPVAKRLEEIIGKKVKKLNDCIGDYVKNEIEKMKLGEIILLENVRFYKEEEKNDPLFAKELASLCDVYVNDAFGTAHRAHASTEGITKFAPISVAGYLIMKELKYLGDALNNPDRPFLAILGGAKISTKIGVIQNLLNKVDVLIICPAMAYTFLLAKGMNVGNSLVEKDKVELANNIIKTANEKNVNILFPIDHVVVKEKKKGAKKRIATNDIFPDEQAVDIGEESIKIFEEEIKKAKTIFWNGPVGIFEIDDFANGTYRIANAMSRANAKTIIGGGDTAAAVRKFGLYDKMTHVSTGGGASLEFLEGKELPGIAALPDKKV
jgi:phosphoglycerate kinase